MKTDSLTELVESHAVSISWIQLDEGAYLQISTDESFSEQVVQVVGVFRPEINTSNVLLLL